MDFCLTNFSQRIFEGKEELSRVGKGEIDRGPEEFRGIFLVAVSHDYNDFFSVWLRKI